MIMQASKGDRRVMHGHHSDAPDRDGEVLDVEGQDGRPPYLVRRGDTGDESLFFPGTDVAVQYFERTADRSFGRAPATSCPGERKHHGSHL